MINRSFARFKRTLPVWIIILLAGSLLPSLEGGEMRSSIKDLLSGLPDRLNGWKLQEQTVYDDSTLYEYINGGAELYLSYGFEELLHLRYEQSDQPEIIVDIFHMGKSQQAFGVFSHSREVIDSTYGQGSQYTAGLLLFWKGPYYVSILASPETPASDRRDLYSSMGASSYHSVAKKHH